MCGIAGTIRMGDHTLVERMTALMAYRGPDDCGLYEDDEVCLGHRRLSILDLSAAGHQPMQSTDGQLVITYNGEIYNFVSLRCELETQGYRFHTGTDTEVILAAYQAYGINCLSKLEGMFAFGLWDRRQCQLLLARDRTGIKPLFYHQVADGLAFASELKPLLYVPTLKPQVNRRALRSAMRYASNIEDEAMIASIFKLRPGYWLRWKDGLCTTAPYWHHPYPAPESWDEETLASELRQRLQRVVHSHMVSDAPLGAALSGGLDSSGVVALMAQNGCGKVETFTVGHGADDPDLLKARLVAEHCRTNHHEILISAENVADMLPRVVWHLEEPLGQMESLQMYLNYREAARFVKVLLIGEGADECFGGYARYKLLNPHLPLPLAMRKALYERVYMYADAPPHNWSARVLARSLWGIPAASPLLDPQPCAALPLWDVEHRRHALGSALCHDQRTYLHDLSLKRADAMGMAHALELRVPFLDRDIVELAARVPGTLMVRGTTEKYILRRALAPLLPSEVVQRRKRGFQMQLNLGLIETLNQLCDTLLRPAEVRARGFFDPARVEALRRKRPGRWATPMAHKVWSYRIWAMLLCEVWARIFLDQPISPIPPASLADVL
jgi:asparagine synthase (glutamine-hydrolysing)